MEKNLQILTWKPFTYQVTKYKSSKKKQKKKLKRSWLELIFLALKIDQS